MQVILSNNYTYTIDNNVVECSPYLKTLRDTLIGKDMEDESYVLDNITLRSMLIYHRFIVYGCIKISNIDELMEISSYMGNTLPYNHGYPDKYHVALIKDWRLQHISKDPELQLIDESTCRTESIMFLDEVFGVNGYYIVGKYVIDICKDKCNGYNNIDVYLTKPKLLDNLLEYCENNNIRYLFGKQSVIIYYKTDFITVFMFKYNNMKEIAYDMDVDSMMIIYHNKGIYQTYTYEYADEHNVNYFRPEKYSLIYSSNLMSMYNLGYKIIIPNFEPLEDISIIDPCKIGEKHNINQYYSYDDQLLICVSFNISNGRIPYNEHRGQDYLELQEWRCGSKIDYIPLRTMDDWFNLTSLSNIPNRSSY